MAQQTYFSEAVLGASKTGLTGTLGYRLIDWNENVVIAFTVANVFETAVPGNYVITGGITLPNNFRGRLEWGTATTKYAEEAINTFPRAGSLYLLASLGVSKTGLAGTLGYRIYFPNGLLAYPFTTVNVRETSVPGNYVIKGGISIIDSFAGYIQWGVGGIDAYVRGIPTILTRGTMYVEEPLIPITALSQPVLSTPTLAVADNANGTATASITGATAGSTNTILYQPADGNIRVPYWLTAGTITAADGSLGTVAGTGTLTFPIAPGMYWGQCQSSLFGFSNPPPPLVFFGVTDGKLAVHEQCVAAVIARLQGMNFLGTSTSPDPLPPANIFAGMVPVDNITTFPCLMVSIEAEAETLPATGAGTNVRDDYGFPIRVIICDQMAMVSMGDQTARRGKYLKWRNQIMRAFSRQRLGGVPEIFDCVVQPQVIVTADMPIRKYFVSGTTLRFFDRMTRGIT